jgi:hypothetical protein
MKIETYDKVDNLAEKIFQGMITLEEFLAAGAPDWWIECPDECKARLDVRLQHMAEHGILRGTKFRPRKRYQRLDIEGYQVVGR